jgi:hypothetical protein
MTLRERTEPPEMLITKVEPETYSMKRHTNVQGCGFPRQKGQRPDGERLFTYINTLIDWKCHPFILASFCTKPSLEGVCKVPSPRGRGLEPAPDLIRGVKAVPQRSRHG